MKPAKPMVHQPRFKYLAGHDGLSHTMATKEPNLTSNSSDSRPPKSITDLLQFGVGVATQADTDQGMTLRFYAPSNF
jgi:hypothetical protein